MRENRVFVGLGANIHDPVARVLKAINELDDVRDTCVVARSSLYRTLPVGYKEQPDFVNAVVKLSTGLSPDELLESLLDIERKHGRVRALRNGPRPLDLDLLLYGDRSDMRAHLTLPHPRMHERAFVLLPLSEIAPDCEIPGRGPVAQLLAKLSDQGVNRIHAA